MAFEVEFTDEFGLWWQSLTEEEQISVDAKVLVLAERGPALGRPSVDTLTNTRIPNLKELRVQHAGEPIRILFVFDPRRVALLLLGGNKAGDSRWYDINIPRAEALYAAHLETIHDE